MSLRWLYLAVLGPLAVLAGLAWWGTEAQLKAAWTDAREEAARLAGARSASLSRELEAAVETAPVYPDPPVPGTASAADDTLGGRDIPALIALRDDPGAGLSPAGLPRRALAALRVQALDPSAQPHALLIRLITEEAPSVLTSVALERLDAAPATTAAWTRAQQARRLAREHPQQAAAGAFLSADAATWWVHRLDDALRFIPPETLAPLLDFTGLPSWATARLADPTTSDDSLVPAASRAVDFPGNPELAILVDPVALEAPIRRQQRWTLALLAAAVLTAGAALVVIHRTVTRERRLADMKSQFVASVSHELRAPVGSIRLMAESLQQRKVAEPGRFHDLIAREGARLSHLIENVLDFARIEDGRKRYRFESCDLAALTRETIDLMQPPADDRGVRLRADLAEVTATVDPAAIQQALVNLLDNALKFSPEGESVSVTLSESDDRWNLAVADRGPGIPPAEHRRVFERFHRLGNELRRETEGAGIGLSIVRHVAEAHGGRVDITGEPPHGATLTLHLPLEPCAS